MNTTTVTQVIFQHVRISLQTVTVYKQWHGTKKLCISQISENMKLNRCKKTTLSLHITLVVGYVHIYDSPKSTKIALQTCLLYIIKFLY